MAGVTDTPSPTIGAVERLGRIRRSLLTHVPHFAFRAVYGKQDSSRKLGDDLEAALSLITTLQSKLSLAEGALEEIEAAPAWGYPESWETTPAEVRQLARDTLAKLKNEHIGEVEG